MQETYDCLVVGGGAAGLSAALALGRAHRRVLVVDAGRQSNLAAEGIGGLLGHDRRPPAELYADAHRELANYPSVEVSPGEVASLLACVDGDRGFGATLADGTRAEARRVLLAGGMDYRHPDLPGIAERWAQGVFHCPFCHGWEMRGRRLAVLGDGPIGTHQAVMLTSWSDDVTLLTDGGELDADQRATLAAAGVTVEERGVTGVTGPGRDVSGVRLEDGSELPFGGLQVRTTLHQRSSLAADLGVAFSEPNPMSPDAIAVDQMFATNLAGVCAAGDVLGRPPSVSAAIASGAMAGAMIVGSLAGVL